MSHTVRTQTEADFLRTQREELLVPAYEDYRNDEEANKLCWGFVARNGSLQEQAIQQ